MLSVCRVSSWYETQVDLDGSTDGCIVSVGINKDQGDQEVQERSGIGQSIAEWKCAALMTTAAYIVSCM